MTNEKAIMCLEDMKIKVPIPKAAKQARENNEALDVAIKTLKSEPHWIPVTERLPEESGRYYVTEWVYPIDDKKHEGKHTKRVNFAEYSATEKKWRRAQALVVVAWMDNEPYKGVTE